MIPNQGSVCRANLRFESDLSIESDHYSKNFISRSFYSVIYRSFIGEFLYMRRASRGNT